MTENPDFRNRAFLVSHIKDTMAFYHPACIDNKGGGFFQHFRDDGSIYDADTRHLVRSTRFIFNYAMAATSLESSESKRQQYLEAVRHGIAYLRNRHCNVQTGGYAWLLSADRVVDATNHCYGLVFVMLAYASAVKAGITEAKAYLSETYELMEKYF